MSTYRHALSAGTGLLESSRAAKLLHVLAEVALPALLSRARLAHLAPHSSPAHTTGATYLQFLRSHEAVFSKFLKRQSFTSKALGPVIDFLHPSS